MSQCLTLPKLDMPFLAFLRLELAAYRRQAAESLLPAVLLLLAVTLYGMAQPAGSLTLRPALAAIWLAIFLLLSLVQFAVFERDRESGLLEQWPLLPIPLEWLVVGKAVAHWIGYALPLLIATPVAALLVGLPPEVVLKLMLPLTTASICLTFLGTLAAACSLRFRSGTTVGMLLGSAASRASTDIRISRFSRGSWRAVSRRADTHPAAGLRLYHGAVITLCQLGHSRNEPARK